MNETKTHGKAASFCATMQPLHIKRGSKQTNVVVSSTKCLHAFEQLQRKQRRNKQEKRGLGILLSQLKKKKNKKTFKHFYFPKLAIILNYYIIFAHRSKYKSTVNVLVLIKKNMSSNKTDKKNRLSYISNYWSTSNRPHDLLQQMIMFCLHTIP